METETLDVAGKKLSLIEAFADLPDPRVVGRSKHDLTEMLVVAVCGLVCGVDDFVGIQLWAKERRDWLRTFLKLENGIPSHDTFGRLFGLLDQAAVEKCFLWLSARTIGAGCRRSDAGTMLALPDSAQAIDLTVPNANNPGTATARANESTAVLEANQALAILLVEDNALNQKLALTLLRRRGYRVTLAENGLKAVEAIASQNFAALLMDMQMPVKGGIEATREIRALEKTRQAAHTPIIAMTANTMQGDQERCLEAGMDDFIGKPINADQLFRQLSHWTSHTMKPGMNNPDN